MRLMLKLSIRAIQRRPLRTLLSMLGIMIGVSGILALGITNEASIRAIENIFEQSSGKTDLIIIPASGSTTLAENVLTKADRLASVDRVLPTIMAQTSLAGQVGGGTLDLSFFGMDSGGLLLYGIDPVSDLEVRDYEITQGRFLSGESSDYELVLVEDYAEEEKIEVEEYIEILTPNGLEKLQVVGLMAREGPGNTNNGVFGVIPIVTAQQMFNRRGEFDQLDILLTESSKNQIEVSRVELETRLGDEVSVTYPAGQGQRMQQMLSNYQIGLNFLSGIALFVGAFLIYNAFAMTVVERTREFGMLRTVGMTRKQIIFQVIMEALTQGIIGSALGAAAGILGARGLTGLMEPLLGADLSSGMTVPINVLILSIGVGIFVTLISALIPSIQAGRVSPIAALKVRGKSQEGWMTHSGWKFGLGMLIISTVILIWNPFSFDPQFILGSMTVFLMFGGVTLIIPATIHIWEKITRPLTGLVYGKSGLIGSRNAGRAKIRTTLTLVALLIGVAMVLIVRIMTGAFANDLIEWIGAYLGGDIYVHSNVSLRADIADQLNGVSGVSAATPIHYQEIDIRTHSGDDETITFMAVDPSTYSRVTNFVFADSDNDEFTLLTELNSGGSIFISSVMAEKYNLGRGDELLIKTRGGFVPFNISAVVVDFYNQGLVVTGNRQDLRRYFRSNQVSTILIKAEDENEISELMTRIDQNYGKRYSLSLESNQVIREDIFTLLDQAFMMFDVMGVLAVIIASLGIINTLTMNIMERTQEIGMLRAIGMTRSQVVMMVLSEAGLIGLIGGLIGVVFGVLLSRIFLTGMTAMSGYKLDFIVPIGGVLMGLVIALGISQLAAFQPARKAAKTNVLEAIRYE
jgi:putative ABC transport system permease protein